MIHQEAGDIGFDNITVQGHPDIYMHELIKGVRGIQQIISQFMPIMIEKIGIEKDTDEYWRILSKLNLAQQNWHFDD